MVAMDTTTVMKFFLNSFFKFKFLLNILNLFNGAKFDYDQIKEENVIRSCNFQIFCF